MWVIEMNDSDIAVCQESDKEVESDTFKANSDLSLSYNTCIQMVCGL